MDDKLECCCLNFCQKCRILLCRLTKESFIFQDRITDLQAQTQHFAEVGHFDADSLQDKSRGIAERYDK